VGAQTQRSLEHFSIGRDLIPREMIAAYGGWTSCVARPTAIKISRASPP